MEELEASSDYRARRKEVAAFNAKAGLLRKGLALTPVKFGISFTLTHLNQAGALVHVYTDGSVQLNHGGTEMGQGLYIKVAQVVAEEFGIGLDRSRITATTPAKVPNTCAHRGLLRLRPQRHGGARGGGKPSAPAWRQWRRKMGGGANEVRFEAGKVRAGGKSMGFAELAHKAFLERVSLSSTGYYATPKIDWDGPRPRAGRSIYFAYGAACSEVTIDTLTGEMRVDRVDILHDVGRSINPAVDIGQIEGGFVQGMGWLTTEELVFDARRPPHAPMRPPPTRSPPPRTCRRISGSSCFESPATASRPSTAPRRWANRR